MHVLLCNISLKEDEDNPHHPASSVDPEVCTHSITYRCTLYAVLVVV